MLPIRHRYVNRLPEIPVDRHGRRDKAAEARLKWDLHHETWVPIRQALDPRGTSLHIGGPANSFYNPGIRLPHMQLEESRKLMAQLVGVKRLDFGTFLKVRNALKQCLASSMMQWDCDIPVCAVLEFARLLSGGEPNPAYGSLPDLPNPRDEYNDEDWFLEDEIDRLLYGEPDVSEAYHSSDYKMSSWVFAWEQIIHDPERFEKEFPGMGKVRPHVEEALRLVFALDPVIDHYAITLTIEVFRTMLATPFMEMRFPTSIQGALDTGTAAA